jgi:hypothetical protein
MVVRSIDIIKRHVHVVRAHYPMRRSTKSDEWSYDHDRECQRQEQCWSIELPLRGKLESKGKWLTVEEV